MICSRRTASGESHLGRRLIHERPRIRNGCSLGCVLTVRDSAADDLYSVSPGSVDQPDITCSRSIPVAAQKTTITARVRGDGTHPVPVRFVLKKDNPDPIVLTAHIQKNATDRDTHEKYVDYRAAWLPSEPGMYVLTVDVDPEDTMGDSQRANNKATVTIPVAGES